MFERVLSTEIEKAANASPSSIRAIAKQLPVKAHGRKGAPRVWTIYDAVLVLVAWVVVFAQAVG